MYAHGSRGERPAFSLASITFTLRMHPLFKTPRLKAYWPVTTEELQVSFVQKILDKKF
jgi:hypothetical protein